MLTFQEGEIKAYSSKTPSQPHISSDNTFTPIHACESSFSLLAARREKLSIMYIIESLGRQVTVRTIPSSVSLCGPHIGRLRKST